MGFFGGGNQGVLSGEIKLYGGAAAPSGYLLCDGASYPRSGYAALFAVIGTAFGSVDAEHFNVPDLRGRVPAGLDTAVADHFSDRLTSAGTGVAGRVLGATGGTESVALNAGQLPVHSHTLDHGHTASLAIAGEHGHALALETSSSGTHFHVYSVPDGSFSGRMGPDGMAMAAIVAGYTSQSGEHVHAVSGNSANGGAHSHAVVLTSHSGSSGDAGEGQMHPNTQPTLVLNFIIKT